MPPGQVLRAAFYPGGSTDAPTPGKTDKNGRKNAALTDRIETKPAKPTKPRL